MLFTKFHFPSQHLSYTRCFQMLGIQEGKYQYLRLEELTGKSKGNYRGLSNAKWYLCNNMRMSKLSGQIQKREHSDVFWARDKMVSSSLFHSPSTFPHNTPFPGRCCRSRCSSAYHCRTCEKPKPPWLHKESTKRGCHFKAGKDIGEYCIQHHIAYQRHLRHRDVK